MGNTLLVLLLGGVLVSCPSLAAEIESLITPGGIRLHHAQLDESDSASFRIHWPSAWLLDNQLNPAVPLVATQLIQTGAAGGLDRAEKAAAFEQLELRALIEAASTAVVGEVLAPADALDEMAALVNITLARPAFERRRLREIRDGIRAGLTAAGGNSSVLSGQLAAAMLYPDSPLRRFYAEIDSGAARDISRNDVIDFHERTLTRRDATVVSAGAFDAARAAAVADAMLEGLPEGGGAELPDARVAVPSRTVVLRAAAAEKSLTVLIGALPDGSVADLFADAIALGMLGQTFTRELNNALRTEFGGGPNFAVAPLPLSPSTLLFQIAGETETGDVSRTLAVVRESYARFRADAPIGFVDLWKDFYARDIAQTAENAHGQTLRMQQNLMRGAPADRLRNAAAELAKVDEESLRSRMRTAFPGIDELLTIVISPDPEALAGACVIGQVEDYADCL